MKEVKFIRNKYVSVVYFSMLQVLTGADVGSVLFGVGAAHMPGSAGHQLAEQAHQVRASHHKRYEQRKCHLGPRHTAASEVVLHKHC